MAFGISGAGSQNDDLNASAPDLEQRKGFIGGGDFGINDHFSGPGGDGGLWSPTGGGEDIANGYKQGGTSAYDKDVDRYRQRGAEGLTALSLDQTQANQSRGLQMGALGLMQNAAQGGAPSRAEALGQLSSDQAMRGAAMAGAAARGPGASVNAMRNASMNVGQQMGAANLQIADMRAKETAAAQQGYAHGAQGVQGQDVQAATTNAQLQAQQNALNEQRQQANERLAFDTRHAQQQNANEWISQQQNEANDRQRQSDAQNAQDWATVQGDASLGFGTGTGLATAATKYSGSDERMKMSVGSLARFARRDP